MEAIKKIYKKTKNPLEKKRRKMIQTRTRMTMLRTKFGQKIQQIRMRWTTVLNLHTHTRHLTKMHPTRTIPWTLIKILQMRHKHPKIVKSTTMRRTVHTLQYLQCVKPMKKQFTTRMILKTR